MENKNIDLNSFKKALHTHHKNIVKRVHSKHKKIISLAKANTVGIVSSALLAGSMVANNINSSALTKVLAFDSKDNGKKDSPDLNRLKIAEDFVKLNELLKTNPNNLTLEQELMAQDTLSKIYGTNFKVTLNGNRMLRVWGYFGQEQHLYRWQGDTLNAHKNFTNHGIAPATGAFGYFDNDKQEQFYIAAPIHLLPNWNTNWSTLKPWYKFRKVLVYNPQNKKAAIAVIGDAGPAEWTGKHFGGSPELMHYLQMKDGQAKSKAVVLFVDDKDNRLDLGPIDPKIINENF